MSSLKQLCLNSIAEDIMRAPPIIQEMIIDNTQKHIEKKVKDEAIATVEQVIPWMIDHILDDMIDSKIANRNYSVNYFIMFNHIDKRIISTAIKSAKILFEKMQGIQTRVVNMTTVNMVDMYDPPSDDEYGYESNRFEDDDDDDDDDEDDDKSFASMRSI